MQKSNLIFVLCLLLVTCTESKPVKVLRVGVLPDHNKMALQQRYRPLLDYLSSQTKIQYHLVIPVSYAGLLELFNNKQVDIAYFGGLTFIQAHRISNAVPLALRDVDTKFVSYFIARANNPKKSIEEFRGSSLMFGSRLSTSGHIMPRFYLTEKSIDVESFFSSVKYSSAHDDTLEAIRNKLADLGAVNGKIYEKILETNPAYQSQVKIIWKTPEYSDYIWAAQDYIDDKTRNAIQKAFLALDNKNSSHKEILDRLGANHFLPGSLDYYKNLISIERQLNMDNQLLRLHY